MPASSLPLELVAAVAEELHPIGDRRTLIALAISCHSFSELVLDMIWKEPSLWSLALHVSEDLRDVIEEDVPGWEKRTRKRLILRAKDTVSPLRLGDRFYFYAKRVQCLRISEPVTSNVVEPSMFLAWFTQDGLFFPRLRKLIIRSYFGCGWPSPEYLNALSRLSPGTLTALHIHLGRDIVSVSVLKNHMPQLLDSCAYLEELKLSAEYMKEWDHMEWAHVLSAMLSRTTRLRILETPLPVHHRDLMHISKFSGLTEIKIGPVVQIPDVALDLPSGAFRHLSALVMEDKTDSAQLSCSMLSFNENSDFSSCHLRIIPRRGLSTFQSISVGQKLGQHTGLTSISLYISWMGGLEWTPQDSAAFFGSLHNLRALRELTIVQSKFYLPIDFDIVTGLIDACPELQTWTLVVTINDGPQYGGCVVPFVAFLDMLHRRPYVRSLPIRLSADIIPSAQTCSDFGTHKYSSVLAFDLTDCISALKETIERILPEVPSISLLSSDGGMPRQISLCNKVVAAPKTTVQAPQTMTTIKDVPHPQTKQPISHLSGLMSRITQTLCMTSSTIAD